MSGRHFNWSVTVGNRPEFLRQIIGNTAINNEAKNFSTALKTDANTWHNHIWQEFENDFNTLPPLHQSILTLLIQHGKSWSPFSEESMSRYRELTRQPSLSISSVQTAIQMLRDNGFIWQSSRGSYALEDENFAEWFKQEHS